MTATGVILGTVDYISPEQARGLDVDGRSDLNCVGVLLYRMLSGELPFKADIPTALIFQHVYEQPRPLTEVAPQVPEALAVIVHTLMQKSPDDRYQTAGDVLNDLHAFREDRPLSSGFLSQESLVPPDGADAVAWRGQGRRLPAIADLPSAPDLDVASPVSRNGLDRALHRLRALFQRHAPQALLDLQNTQQQIGGALALYETRGEELAQLVAEAQAVRDELAAAAEQA